MYAVCEREGGMVCFPLRSKPMKTILDRSQYQEPTCLKSYSHLIGLSKLSTNWVNSAVRND